MPDPSAQFIVTPVDPNLQEGQNPVIPTVPNRADSPLSDENARIRAFKAKMGMGDRLPGTEDELRTRMANGEDFALRQSAAAKRDEEAEVRRQQVIGEFARNMPNGINQSEFNFISKAFDTATQASDPKSVFEEEMAKYSADQADRTRKSMPGTVLDDVAQDTPQVYDALKNTAANIQTKREFALTQAQNAEEAVQKQGWFGWTVDQLKTAVPLYQSAKLRGWMQNTPIIASASGFGLGSNLYDQTSELLSLPFPEYKRRFTQIMDHLMKDNPTLAVTWARAVVGMSTSEQALQSGFEVFDLATVAPIAGKLGKAAINKAKNIVTAKEAMKDLVKATEGEEASKVKLAQGLGDAKEAGIQKQVQIDTDLFKGQPKPVQEALDSLPQYLKQDADQLRSNPGHLGQEVANRLADKSLGAAKVMMETLVQRTNVERISLSQLSEDARRAIFEEEKNRYRGVKNAILNMRLVGIDPISNSMVMEKDIGRSSGVLFAKPLEARNFANVNGLQNVEVVRQGAGYKLVQTTHVPMNTNAIRDNALKNKLTIQPTSWVDAWRVNWLRTPQDTLSTLERANRSLASTAPASILNILKTEAQDIQSFARRALPGTSTAQKFDDWARIIQLATDMKDADGNFGVFFNHIGELDNAYINLIGRSPDEQEAAAYFAFKRIMAMDLLLRNVRMYGNKANLGVASHKFSVFNDAGEKVWSPDFDARIVNRIPGGNDTIVIAGPTENTTKVMTADELHRNTELTKQIQSELNQGKGRMLEIFSVNSRPLADFAGVTQEHRPRWIYTKTDNVSPLSWDQVPRRGGGHFGYDFEHKIVLANVREERVGSNVKHWYEDDIPIAGVMTHAMGKDAAEKMTQTARLIGQNKMAEAQALWEQHFPLGLSWEDFKGLYEPYYLNGKKMPPRARTDIPFTVVGKNVRSVDVDKTIEKLFPKGPDGKDTFYDGTRRGSLEKNYQVEFTQQRDAEQFLELKNTGTAQEPYYTFEPAAKTDPIQMMNRATQKIINSTWLEDYKQMSIEHWINDAMDLLKADKMEIRSNPYGTFAEAQKQSFKPAADPIAVDRLLLRKAQLEQFMGVKDRFTTLLERAGQNMLDIAYESKGVGKVAYVPAYMLNKIKEPLAFVRSVVFNENMGFYNWTQVFNQLQSFVTIWGMAGPTKALPGTAATLLHEWATWTKNPRVLAHLDDLAVKITNAIPGLAKFKPGEFTESVKAMESTGFNIIGSEVAMIDDRLNDKVIRGNFKSVLENAQMFFRWPESKIRMGAWHTAYLEFREKKPFGRLTNSDILSIRSRADDLYQNMTSASVSMIQRGLGSIPTQFLTYQIRAAELFLGKRLAETPVERAKVRAKLFATLAAAYGVPSAMGVTGVPFNEFIRKDQTEKGYVPGDNLASTSLMEGLGSVVGAIVQGGDYKSGTYYNLSEKGVAGMDMIKDVIRQDKSILALLGGATGTSLASKWESADGLISATMSMIRGDGKFPIKMDDFLDPFKDIRTLDKATKLVIALNTGKWISRNGTWMGDVTKTEALVMTALGLNKEDFSTVNLQNWSLKDQNKLRNEGYKKFAKEYRKALDALNNNDPDAATDYFKRGRNYLLMHGYDELTLNDAFARVNREIGSLYDRTNFDFFRKAPLNQSEDRLKALQTRKELQDRRILINGQ